MQQHLKSRLLEFLCSIRSKLIVFRAIEELKNILDQIDNTSGQNTPTNSLPMNYSTTNGSSKRTQSSSGEAPSIGFSHLMNDLSTTNESNSSPGNSIS
jgi:hypothetical protein